MSEVNDEQVERLIEFITRLVEQMNQATAQVQESMERAAKATAELERAQLRKE